MSRRLSRYVSCAESHREKLLLDGKVFVPKIAAVAAYTFLKLVGGQKIH